jgi:hypothetical protein
MKKILFILSFSILLVACQQAAEVTVDSPDTDTLSEPEAMLFTATLADVNGGDTIGSANSSYLEDYGYTLQAEFPNLPALEEGFFYEGWIVRPEPLSVISTGKLMDHLEAADVYPIDDGAFINSFDSKEDLTDHIKYILTLEPDDGDPAPAAHVLEGTFGNNQ